MLQQIEKNLLANLMINGQAPAPGQIVFKNVELMISRDGGKTWVKATAEDFREGGITVEVDYPEGTNGREYLFAVAHMLTIDMNGRKAGEIEIPEVETTEKGLRFTLNGLSPVAISWQKLDDVAGASLPNTGDGSNPIRYMAMLLIALAGIGMIVRKRK